MFELHRGVFCFSLKILWEKNYTPVKVGFELLDYDLSYSFVELVLVKGMRKDCSMH